MKKLSIILASMGVLPVLSFAPVLAHEADSGSDHSSTVTTSSDSSNTTTATSSDDSNKPEVEPTEAEIKTRVESLKAKLKTKLDDLTKKKIELKCKGAQGLVEGNEKSVNAAQANRSKAYDKIFIAVQRFIDKRKAEGKDTTALEAALTTAKAKNDALNKAFTDYKATIVDLRKMDCATDPTGFKSLLDTARTQREAVRTAAQAVHDYIKSTLKPEIAKLRTEIESEKNSSSSTEDKTNTSTGGSR